MAQHTAATGPETAVSWDGTPVAPGDHLCALYRGPAERDELIRPFLSDGLRAGHICLLLAAPDDAASFRETLAGDEAPSGDGPSGRLQIQVPQDGYLEDGAFDGDRMLRQMADWSAEMFRGCDGAVARLAADMSWAGPLLRPAFTRGLIRYEMRVAPWLRSYPQVGVCMYDLDVFGGDLIIPLVKAHAKIWVGGRLVENPYHLVG
ncbi:MEDS domain-containing protein [Streptomyces coffeae]|uniref:MEDS domain-containing protein n=1 Tax=Streptomyces coffeae TaxID=621382 RepID=A0ABS1NBP3_9ACTN|nr:MEDS domain-containing protein [Streptomyces coffeae]MBL1097300.1 MEDS domain-containing protein [Streptomyces coffeae]